MSSFFSVAGRIAVNAMSSSLNHLPAILAAAPKVTPVPLASPPTGRNRPSVSPTSMSWSWTGAHAPASGLEAARVVSSNEPTMAARMNTVPPRR